MAEFSETAHSSALRLEIEGTVADADPDAVYRAFVDPALLTRWWADEGETDPVVGGRLVARWPSMSWVMRGTFTELDPGRAVGFTWSWDHEPDIPPRTVRIRLERSGDGTLVTLSHGDYTAADSEERRSHLDGWRHFLPRLAAALRD
jgi:uncharacterized protein YndB with AHSA1/START domain